MDPTSTPALKPFAELLHLTKMAGESTFGILNVDLSEQLGEKKLIVNHPFTIFVPMTNDHWVVNPPVSDTRHILGHWIK